MDKVKIAMVGCGGICDFHLSHLVLFDDVEFVGFMDIRHERALEKAAKAGRGKVYDDYITMLDDAKPDALYICVPPDQQVLSNLKPSSAESHFWLRSLWH